MVQNMVSGGFSGDFLRKDSIFRRKSTREDTAGGIFHHGLLFIEFKRLIGMFGASK